MIPTRWLRTHVMRASRERKLAHFYSLYRDGMTVLDVGVASEDRPGFAERNYLLKHFRYAPGLYTGLGIEDLSGMAARFPGRRFLQYDGRTFPFPDDSFDWAHCNAVIEHVGGAEARRRFLEEMLRVARSVFFTTPNQWFPIETHTMVPLLHWHGPAFRAWCRKRRPNWTPDNLWLFSLRTLRRMLDESSASEHSIQRNRLCGLTMTFTVVCRRRREHGAADVSGVRSSLLNAERSIPEQRQ
jgi:hypothetical protein